MQTHRAAAAPSEAADPVPTPVNGLALQRLTQAIRGFTGDQLLWSSGYLAGLAAARVASAAEPGASPALAAAPAVRLTILYASQTGNARAVAEALGRQAAARRLAHRVVSAADYRPRDLAKEHLVLLVASTQGEGEPPESAAELHRFLQGPGAPSLSRLAYGVFGLGDSSYEHFCKAAVDFDRRLEELGARRLLARVDADLDFRSVSEGWIPLALERVERELPVPGHGQGQVQGHVQGQVQGREADVVPLRAAIPVRHDRDRPYRAIVLDQRPIVTADAVTEVRHLALAIDPQAISYAPGDSLGVRFRNDPALVGQVLAATALTAETPVDLGSDTLALSEALTARLELTRLHPGVVSAWSRIAGDPGLAALVEDREALRRWCRTRQVIDLVQAHPARPDGPTLVGLLQPIAPRLYSIASSQAETEDEVHLAVGVLRYRVDGQGRVGGASGFLSARVGEGDALEVFVAENPQFRLPQDGDTPIVLVGAGTGVAPFRAFLQQRAATGDRGRNWLVFGNRHQVRDFLYQTDWLRLRKAGLLHRFSPAFSRDGPRRVYVQDRLRTEGAELWRWLDQGARIYVCGATAMEAAVREALVGIARDHGGLSEADARDYPETLRQDGRYLRDTY